MVLISMSLISLVRRFGQLFKALHTQGVCKKAWNSYYQNDVTTREINTVQAFLCSFKKAHTLEDDISTL